MKTKRVLSLFSGAGGMDLGFEGNFTVPEELVNTELYAEWVAKKAEGFIHLKPTGFKTVFANDISIHAKAAWVPFFSNRGTLEEAFHLGSIVDLVKSYYDNRFMFPSNIDIVIGGFPCQDFSLAGKRRGFESTKDHHGKENLLISPEENRGNLYKWMQKVIEIVKPKIFIAENVKGLSSLKGIREKIEEDFRNIDNGYIIAPTKLMYAPDYGIPQKRERIIFIGINKKYIKKQIEDKLINGIIDLYPPPSHGQTLFSHELRRYTKTSHVLKNLLEPELSQDIAQQSYSKAKYCPGSQGQIEIDLSGLSPTIRAEHHGNIEYRRLSLEKGGKYKKELDLNMSERRLTVRECARIQTFPDEYEFVRKDSKFNLSASNAYKLIGNAVPPLMAYHIAMHIRNLWFDLFALDEYAID